VGRAERTQPRSIFRRAADKIFSRRKQLWERSGGGGGNTGVVAVLVIFVIIVLAGLVVSAAAFSTSTKKIDVNINTPSK
jgi:hypothetical protein